MHYDRVFNGGCKPFVRLIDLGDGGFGNLNMQWELTIFVCWVCSFYELLLFWGNDINLWTVWHDLRGKVKHAYQW